VTVKPTAHGILLSRSVGVPVPHCEIIVNAVEENELPITGAMRTLNPFSIGVKPILQKRIYTI